ncbi:Transcriptional regulatory protein of IclR family [Aromatoleum aromaticum EbN1]|uniref:Transcriptional regulatory protein of IclR family n=2 Tax=Aromatoleum aromaticum TaxID=551760 RepID=Q5P027_AROAE|nr:IclR family transcriptional regulator [Aromatoleum aromaticum]NMG54849.1 helix-turn-helix domain-containing protein [Aromatoleum aromaticum]CAI09337.1 Transcriptional regulatory protein of IclR family [Aromatoleum aromaticum EbN1]
MQKEHSQPEKPTGDTRRTSPEKMIEILDLFEEEHLRWTPEQMMERLQCPRSTLYRYLRVLTDAGLVTSLPDIGYTIGPRIAELDYVMRTSDPLIASGRPLLQALVKEIAGIGLLCRYYKDRVLCVHQEAGASEIHSSYERGRAMPITVGATSRVILAHLKLSQLRLHYERHSEEFRQLGMGRNSEEVQEHLREIRKQGYCLSRGEVTPGVIGIAAPVFDSENTIIGSLSLVIPETGFNERRRRQAIDRLTFSARVLTNSMRRHDET